MLFTMKASVLSCFLFLLLNLSLVEAGGVKGLRRGGLSTTKNSRRQQRLLKGSKSSKSSSKKQVGPTKRECTSTTNHKSSKSSKKSGASSSSSGGMQFECVTKGEGVDDKIKFNVVSQDNQGLTISVEYKQKGDDVDDLDTADVEKEIKTSYEITFDEIIEYRQPDILVVDPPAEAEVAVTRAIDDDPANTTTTATDSTTFDEEEVDPNVLAFNWESDEILQTVLLGDWDDFSEIDDDGSTIRFSITSLEGLATFYFTIAMDDDTNENDDFSVNKMKIDFELANFPWAAEDSYVALVSSVTSGQKIKVLSDTEQSSGGSKKKKGHTTKKEVQISFEDASGVMDFLPFGDYTWKEEAQVVPRDAVLSNGNETIDVENNVTTTSTAQTRSADTTIRVVATSPSKVQIDSEDYDYYSEAATAANQQENNGEDSTSDQIIAFSFVGKPAHKAEDIYWDPSVGVGYSDESAAAASSNPTQIQISSAATVSLLSLVTMVFTLVLSF